MGFLAMDAHWFIISCISQQVSSSNQDQRFNSLSSYRSLYLGRTCGFVHYLRLRWAIELGNRDRFVSVNIRAAIEAMGFSLPRLNLSHSRLSPTTESAALLTLKLYLLSNKIISLTVWVWSLIIFVNIF